MKYFIFKILIFSLSITVIVGFGIGWLNSSLDNAANFKIGTTSKYLILGHSHPQTAFNDSLIPDFLNKAQSGEAYFYTYLKAKL